MASAPSPPEVPAASIIDPSRRLELNHEPWTVRRLTSFYEPPTPEHPGGTGRLYLPPHQREWSWKNKKGVKKMQKFIDSVLHNYPIPTIILNAIDDGHRERWQIYDGRHRVETLWKFINNEVALDIEDGRKVLYRNLSDGDRDRFNNRQIPVVTTFAATPAQLAEVFIRLNSGKPLTQADYCWACRDSPLIRDTIRVLNTNKGRFAPLFGGADITHRKSLPDWVGVMAGIITDTAANMTTSFERHGPHLNKSIPAELVTTAMDALFELYTRANIAYATTPQKLKKYQSLGFINAFFFHDWLEAADAASKETVIANWVRVIGHIRTSHNRWIVMVEGAQNLNSHKLSCVRAKVGRWIATGHTEGSDDGSDDDDESDV